MRNIYKEFRFTGSRFCVNCNGDGKCPHCGGSLRTILAEQCPYCGASWRVLPPTSLESFSRQFNNKEYNPGMQSMQKNMSKQFRPKMNYLFFDVETTGLPIDWKAPTSDLENWPRIVEIAWILSDENGNELEVFSSILKNDNFSIPIDASKIHQITDEIANTKGRERIEVFKQFADVISKAQTLVAHNIEFDFKVLHSEFIRYGIKSGLYKINKACTKELSTDYCKLPGNYGYKWPKLEELFRKVFGKELLSAHSASIDVKACKDCFFELAKQGVFQLFGSNVKVDTITNVDDDSLIQVDPFREEINYNGYYQFYTRVRHLGLNEQKFIKAGDEYTLEDRVERQKERFNLKWENAKDKILANQLIQTKKFEAEYRTQEVEKRFKEIENLLESSLHLNNTLDWKKLENHKEFEEQSPELYLGILISQITKPKKPKEKHINNEPNEEDEIYVPRFNVLEKYFFKSLKEKKIARFKSLYQKAYNDWLSEKKRIVDLNKKNQERYIEESINYNKTIETIKNQNLIDIEAWQKRKLLYEKKQVEHNAEIERFKLAYLNKEKLAILKYCSFILNNSEYPGYFPKSFNLVYVEESELLIVDYCLPEKTNFPTVKLVKYNKYENVFKETKISETKLNSLYASAVFQLCVRTKNELYKSDTCNAVKHICFNGFLNQDDKQFVISVLSDKETFLSLQLKGVECKDILKKFKGNFNNRLTTIEPTITTQLYGSD
jgi:DNA polymerase III epsilon subunit-like protein